MNAAALFDLDGTLVDTEHLATEARAQLAGEWGDPSRVPTAQDATGVADRELAALMLTMHGRQPDALAINAAYERLITLTEERLRGGVHWMPGASDLLAALRAAEIPLGLVTSTERRITEIILDQIGRPFQVTVCGDEVGKMKPDREPYSRAMRLLGVEPARCVAVEDSRTGAESALAADCGRVVVVPSSGQVMPDHPRVVRVPTLAGLSMAELCGPLTPPIR